MKKWLSFIQEKSFFIHIKKNDVKKQIDALMKRLHNITSDTASQIQRYYSANDKYLMKNSTWFKEFSKSSKSYIKTLEDIKNLIDNSKISVYDLAYELINYDWRKFSKKHKFEEAIYQQLNAFFAMIPETDNFSTNTLGWKVSIKNGAYIRTMKMMPAETKKTNDKDKLKESEKSYKAITKQQDKKSVVEKVFKITTDWMKKEFKKLNKQLFNNELTTPKFILKNLSSMGGFFDPNNNSITMTTYFEFSEEETRNTLAHEMIHLWQKQKNYGDVHGTSFKRKAQEIKRISGIEINRTKSSLAKVSSDIEKFVDILVYGDKWFQKFTDKKFNWKNEKENLINSIYYRQFQHQYNKNPKISVYKVKINEMPTMKRANSFKGSCFSLKELETFGFIIQDVGKLIFSFEEK